MKVLIIRFSSIGDIVLTSPVVRCLKKQTGAEIHYLTKQAYAGIVQSSPYIDRVWTIHQKVSEVTSSLREECFDVIIDLHKNLRSWEVQLRLGKKALTFDKANVDKWMMVHLHNKAINIKHVVQRYMDSLKTLGIQYDGGGLDYALEAPGDYFQEIKKPYVCFAIGGTHFTKRLPVSKISSICQGLNLPVYLLGGPSDRAEGDLVAKGRSNILNLCGQCSLSDSARIVKDASLVITHDTGLMHIAAAFSRPILSIWGNTVPAFGMYPFLPDHVANHHVVAEVKGLACRPCSKIGYKSCPQGHFKCMNDQDTGSIVSLAHQLLSKNPLS